jgi:hypothetical protein
LLYCEISLNSSFQSSSPFGEERRHNDRLQGSPSTIPIGRLIKDTVEKSVIPVRQAKAHRVSSKAKKHSIYSLNHFALIREAKFAPVLASVPEAQKPRSMATHKLIVDVKGLLEALEKTPNKATALVSDFQKRCDVFLANPNGENAADTKIVDTQSLRDEIEKMVAVRSPKVLHIPPYPGGKSAFAKQFFEEHYGQRYNQKGLEVIFAPDLFVIDPKLIRAMRFAYNGADNLPIGGKKDKTDAIAAGRFGSKMDRWKTGRALFARQFRAQY